MKQDWIHIHFREPVTCRLVTWRTYTPASDSNQELKDHQQMIADLEANLARFNAKTSG